MNDESPWLEIDHRNKDDGPYLSTNFPLWLAKDDTQQVQYWESVHLMGHNEPLWGLCTHWKSAEKPKPPQEPDSRWLKEYMESRSLRSYAPPDEVWCAPLAWERKRRANHP